jgi:hypothetical protein
MNMRQSFITSTVIAIGFATAVPAIAEQTTETTETTVTTVQKGHHHYVYYGDHDIYFAPESKTYYWQEGKEWRSGLELPQSSRSYITNGGVQIDLDTERPYERNDWVVKHYKNGNDHDDGDGDHDHR